MATWQGRWGVVAKQRIAARCKYSVLLSVMNVCK